MRPIRSILREYVVCHQYGVPHHVFNYLRVWTSILTILELLEYFKTKLRRCQKICHFVLYAKKRNNLDFKFTRRYGPLRGPTSSSCGGLWPSVFLPFDKKRGYYAVLAHFWHLLVSSSNLGNF